MYNSMNTMDRCTHTYIHTYNNLWKSREGRVLTAVFVFGKGTRRKGNFLFTECSLFVLW